MDDFSDAFLGAIGKTGSGVKILQATFVSASATAGCFVDVQANRIPAVLGTSWLPEVNEIVWLWVIDDRYFIMGPAAVKPDQGTVASVAGGLVTLTSNLSTTVVAPYSGTTPSAGQVMKLSWHNGPFAQLMSTSPAPAAPPTPSGAGTTTHNPIFTAIDAGSYQSSNGWWTSRVYASDINIGCWFYGSKIPDSIPAAATIQKVEIWISPAQISGSAPIFAVHGYGSKPGGAPSVANVSAVAIAGGWITLPTSIGNNLKAGGGYAGVGVNTGGYNILHSLAEDGMSGALRITYTY